MKKIVFILLVVFAVSGCDMVFDIYFNNVALGLELYDGDFPEMLRFGEIGKYVNSVLHFEDDFIDHWENPQDTINKGFGDCDNFAITFANIAFFALGIKCDIVILNTSYSREIVKGGIPVHVILYYNGFYYDPISDRYYYDDPGVGYIYKFDDVFNNN